MIADYFTVGVAESGKCCIEVSEIIIRRHILARLITSPRTNAKLTKNPVTGIQAGNTLTPTGCGSRRLIRYSARFTTENMVNNIVEATPMAINQS